MLQLAAATALLAHLNIRLENHGKDKKRPAVDLKFTADVPNTMLEDIHPGLLHSLYRREDEKGHQADMTAEPGTLTTPRYPKARPWASTEDWPGYFANLRSGEFDPVRIELDKVTLKGVVVEARNGGTVGLTFTCSAYPTADDVAKLYGLLGQSIEVDVQPPKIGDLQRLRDEAKAARKAEPEADAGDDDGQSGPISDAQAGRAFPDALDGRREPRLQAVPG
jgi:hypothetical protein